MIAHRHVICSESGQSHDIMFPFTHCAECGEEVQTRVRTDGSSLETVIVVRTLCGWCDEPVEVSQDEADIAYCSEAHRSADRSPAAWMAWQ